ncbi:MAG: class I SAM-dependent methyltransferase, partial [Promethearchaeati archaeon]
MKQIHEIKEFISRAYHRHRSPADYQRFQRLQAKHLRRYLSSKLPTATCTLVTLDVGCGNGGYVFELMTDLKFMVGIDTHIDLARQPENDTKHGHFIQADALELPFDSSSFNLVICSSLIEHVCCARHLLNEIDRVLSPGGWCYLSFPPFYSLRGGHGFSPFHLLGERVAIFIHNA